ncbi:uncharacterized protein LOC105739397 isoform X1 [Nomascus leucogenys]|uniref:uncharacterized protein LOC105739397 isoform X1 n=1 Tax=Nomascus leucogenys TaxID=61853 RepID=UPI00122D76F1|nr:uncharacterized protein LOC105739397 isoform X1 [Nomascus leucogenys]
MKGRWRNLSRSAEAPRTLAAGLPSLPPSRDPGPAEAGVRGGLALGHSAGAAPPRAPPGQATRRPEPGAPASGCRPAPAARPAFVARSAPVPPPGGFRFRFPADVVEENESGRGQDWRSCRFRRGAQNAAAASLERGPWGRGPRRARWQHTLAAPNPHGSPEDGQQRNKKMDSLAAGELNASHQPWVPELVAYWRKTHQDHLCSLHSWAFGLLDARETQVLRGPEPVPGKDRLLLAAFPAEASPVDTASVSVYGRAPRYMHKGVKKCVCTPDSKNSIAWLLLGGILQVALIRVICSSVFLTLCTITPCSFYLCTFLIKESC